jgi:hypothetical protein
MPIRHSQIEAQPRAEAFYRCDACQLDLLFDPAAGELAVRSDTDGTEPRRERKRICADQTGGVRSRNPGR